MFGGVPNSGAACAFSVVFHALLHNLEHGMGWRGDKCDNCVLCFIIKVECDRTYGKHFIGLIKNYLLNLLS